MQFQPKKNQYLKFIPERIEIFVTEICRTHNYKANKVMWWKLRITWTHWKMLKIRAIHDKSNSTAVAVQVEENVQVQPSTRTCTLDKKGQRWRWHTDKCIVTQFSNFSHSTYAWPWPLEYGPRELVVSISASPSKAVQWSRKMEDFDGWNTVG